MAARYVLFLALIVCVSAAKKIQNSQTQKPYSRVRAGDCNADTCKPSRLRVAEATSLSMTVEWYSPPCLPGHTEYLASVVSTDGTARPHHLKAECEGDVCRSTLDAYTVPVMVTSCTKYSIVITPDDENLDVLDCSMAGDVETGPPQPKYFRTFDMTATSASLKWEVSDEHSSCITGFDLQATVRPVPVGGFNNNLKPGENYTSRVTVPSCTDCTYELSGLLPCTEYDFKIRALTSREEVHSDSAMDEDMTLVGVPGPVGNFSGKTTSDERVELTWTRPVENFLCVTGYDISYTCESGYDISCQTRRIHVDGATTTTAAVDGLQLCTPYHFTIMARTKEYDIVGQMVNITLQTSSQAPGEPRNVEEVEVTPSYITLSWDPPQTESSSCKVILYHVTCSSSDHQRSILSNTTTDNYFNSCPCDPKDFCVCTKDTKANVGCPEKDAPNGDECLNESTDYRCDVRAYNGMWGTRTNTLKITTDNDGLSGGAIAAIVICSILLLVILVVGGFLLVKYTRSRQRRKTSRSSRNRKRSTSYEQAPTHDATYSEKPVENNQRDSSDERT